MPETRVALIHCRRALSARMAVTCGIACITSVMVWCIVAVSIDTGVSTLVVGLVSVGAAFSLLVVAVLRYMYPDSPAVVPDSPAVVPALPLGP